MKIVEYSINIGNYDPPRTDMIVIKDVDIFRNNARNARMVKMLPHKFFDCDVSIQWDGHMRNIAGLTKEQIVEKYLGDYDMVATKAPPIREGCVYKEIKAARNRINNEHELHILKEQEKHYRKIGVPENIGTLAEYQPHIRRHNTRMIRFNEAWWAEMCRWSYRDQVSFPVVLAQHPDVKINWIELGTLAKKQYSHGGKTFPNIR